MSSATQLPAHSPRTFSQILDRIYRILRADIRTHLGIAMLPAGAFFLGYGSLLALWGVLFLRTAKNDIPLFALRQSFLIFDGFLVFMLVHLIVLGVFLAAASYASVRADCGLSVAIKEAYAVAWGRAGHFIRLILSVYCLCFFPALLLEALIAGAVARLIYSKELSTALIVIIPFGALLLSAAFVGGAFIALRLSLAFPASVFESLNIRTSIKRSWALTRGATGKIFLIILAVYAAIYIATMVVMMIVMFVALIVYLSCSSVFHPSPNTVWILGLCGSAVYLGLMSVFSACSWTGFATGLSIIYNDQRLRTTAPVQAGAQG